ncbi:MAG: tetratricopeptide repeat protein [Deltaproteobacteria bacterium]|nr:tetratricopeptide repeat protein [Deltaproteobacteria bacterium]
MIKTLRSRGQVFKVYTALMAVLLITSGCAGTTHQKVVSVNKQRPETIQKYERPEQIQASDASPSGSLVSEGIIMLKESRHSEAEWRFEEAVNLDPDYGPAYYWLARAKFRLEEIKNALSLLEKAEALLNKSEVWMDRIYKFRSFLLAKLE